RRSVGLHTAPRVGYRQPVSVSRHRVTTGPTPRRRPTTERPPTAGESADRGPNHRRRDLPWLTEAYPPRPLTPAPAPAPAATATPAEPSPPAPAARPSRRGSAASPARDRKSTRLNSSHVKISYAVFC